MAAGISHTRLDHDEVTRTAERVEKRFVPLLSRVIEEL
jgi:purine nucleoside phosphorylase